MKKTTSKYLTIWKKWQEILSKSQLLGKEKTIGAKRPKKPDVIVVVAKYGNFRRIGQLKVSSILLVFFCRFQMSSLCKISSMNETR